MIVRTLRADERESLAEFYEEHWGTARMARLGELVDLRTLPALVAENDGEVVWSLTPAIPIRDELLLEMAL